MEFIVEDIKHINVKVNGKWFDLAEFAEHFILSVTLYLSLLQCINTKVQTYMRTIIYMMSSA